MGAGSNKAVPGFEDIAFPLPSLARRRMPDVTKKLEALSGRRDPRVGGETSQHGNTSNQYGRSGRSLMRYKPKNVAALHIALAGLPDKMRVEVDPDIGMSAKTVAELRNVTAWPENFVIATPQERYPENAVRVSKATHATRVSPNP
jgi:hypothetical protein